MTARAARVVRGMSLGKASILVFVLVAILTTLFMVKMSQGEALPASPTDASAVPHYFGPWPNWALSPTTEASATVTINGNGTRRDGSGHGRRDGRRDRSRHGHHHHQPREWLHLRDGRASPARAREPPPTPSSRPAAPSPRSPWAPTAAPTRSPTVSITGGGATTAATATAFGGVDAVTLANAGSGYTAPTVDFDLPDDPNGTKATAHAQFNAVTGAVTGITVIDPGSGYSSAPGVVIRDGTLMDPIAGGLGASATATTQGPERHARHLRRRLHVRSRR